MASPPSKHTIHVVGGAGTQSGKSDQNGGGYVESGTATYSTFQGSNGGPTSDNGSAWDPGVTACAVTQHGSAPYANKLRITKIGAFANCVAGSLANVDFQSVYTDGVYEVLAAAAPNYIVIDCDYTSDDNCRIKVGGAYATLQNMMDNDATNAASYNRTIYTNLAETLTAAIDIDTNGGNVSKNTHKRLIGYKTTFGDMNYGGAYYQGPLDAYKNGVDTNKCVRYDAGGGAYAVFTVSVHNVQFSNIYMYNTTLSAPHSGVLPSGSPSGLMVLNCKFASVFRAVNWDHKDATVIGCYTHSDIVNKHYDSSGTGSSLSVLGCVLNATTFARTVTLHGDIAGWIEGNIFIGDGVDTERALEIKDAFVVVCNNTFYNYMVRAISLEDAASRLIEFNNIFVLTAVDDYAVYALAANGTILYSDYSWAYCAAGDFTVEPWYDDTNDVGFQGAHSTKDVDPQLVDPANGDFRLVNPDVLRGGRPDADDNAGQIGAIEQKYQFVQRSRLTNRGRLGTFR